MLSIRPSLLKSHAYEVIFPEDWSVNWTFRGAVPEVGVPVNAATGATGPVVTVMTWVPVALLPALSVAVQVIVVSPIGKVEPDSGVHDEDAIPLMESVAV